VTELIRHQLFSMGLMVCGGMASGMVYGFFGAFRARLKSRILSGAVQLFALVLAGYCASVFFYAGHYGKITFQGAACFLAGVVLWKKLIFTEDGETVHGKEGEQASGVREEPQGAGYFQRTGSTAEKEN